MRAQALGREAQRAGEENVQAGLARGRGAPLPVDVVELGHCQVDVDDLAVLLLLDRRRPRPLGSPISHFFSTSDGLECFLALALP